MRARAGPLLLGLTGSIGMGKSTVARMFARAGVPVFDADAAVRTVQAPGGRAVEAIAAAFPGTTGPAGVDRTALGAAVFGRPEALATLERIVHPEVARLQAAFLQANRGRRLVVLDVPLLLERGGWRRVDLVVVVSAPARVQRARVLARPGMSPGKLAAVLAHQMPDREKRARADIVIETGRGRLSTWRAVRRVVREAAKLARVRRKAHLGAAHARDRARHRDHRARPGRGPPDGGAGSGRAS